MHTKYIEVPGIYNNRINCQPLNKEGWEKTADDKSSKLDTNIRNFVESVRPNIDKHIYTLLTALGAAEAWGCNSNFDIFNEEDLKPINPAFGHKTFLNAGVYTHHKNKDKSKSLGEVCISVYNPKMRRVELIERIDRDKAKKFNASDVYDRLSDGEYLDVSMGCKVKYDVCAICGNKAPTRAQYCNDMLTRPGRILEDGRIVAVINPRPYFFDISFVTIGAAKNAKTMGTIEEKNGTICLGDICTPVRHEKTAKVISDADIGVKRKLDGESGKDFLISAILRDSAIQRETKREQSNEVYEGLRALIHSSNPERERVIDDELNLALSSIKLPKLANKKNRRVVIGGLPVVVEYEKGDMRKGKGWSTKMECAYGYIPKTSGHDEEAVDVYINDTFDSDRVFIIKQIKENKTFDEDKIMLGFPSKEVAKQMYLKHIPQKFFGAILESSMENFTSKYLLDFKKEAQINLASFNKVAHNCKCGGNCCTTSSIDIMANLLEKTSASIIKDTYEMPSYKSNIDTLKKASQNKSADIIKKIPALVRGITNDTKETILKGNKSFPQIKKQ